MSIDIYKYAAQNNLLFASTKGGLTVNQLFALPLTSRTGFDLDTVAKGINNELKSISEESFVTTASSPRKKPLEVALEIVKDVIATKQAESAAELAKRDKAEKRKKILDAMAAKQDEKLSASSLEDLERQLAELEA